MATSPASSPCCCALAGIAAALPVGLWAMQTAYTAGSPQLVICCLVLVDPTTAGVGGYLLLNDGVALPASSWVTALLCISVAVAGVVLLSLDYPAPGGGPTHPKLATTPPAQEPHSWAVKRPQNDLHAFLLSPVGTRSCRAGWAVELS